MIYLVAMIVKAFFNIMIAFFFLALYDFEVFHISVVVAFLSWGNPGILLLLLFLFVFMFLFAPVFISFFVFGLIFIDI